MILDSNNCLTPNHASFTRNAQTIAHEQMGTITRPKTKIRKIETNPPKFTKYICTKSPMPASIKISPKTSFFFRYHSPAVSHCGDRTMVLHRPERIPCPAPKKQSGPIPKYGPQTNAKSFSSIKSYHSMLIRTRHRQGTCCCHWCYRWAKRRSQMSRADRL